MATIYDVAPRILRASMLVLLAAAALSSRAGANARPADILSRQGSLVFRFGPATLKVPDGVILSDGSNYSAQQGYGWDRDMTRHTRLRDTGFAGVALLDRDISEASFTIDLPDGDYLFDVTCQDDFAGALAVKVNGAYASAPIPYTRASQASLAVPITSVNGKATVTFVGGKDGFPNALISSLTITLASAVGDRFEKARQSMRTYQTATQEAAARRAAARVRQRKAYKPITLAVKPAARQEFDLTGKWLFRPARSAEPSGADPAAGDSDWHVMDVPQFWNPIQWWLYVPNREASHNFERRENERCENYTFDYRTTRAGWYRQWINVPASLQAKSFVVRFGAVASLADVYWNGHRISSHVGMFAPFECDVSRYVAFGKPNLLAVYVSSGTLDTSSDADVAAVAVTVKVTQEMLRNLPHDGYRAGMGGIWQPVSLEVANRSRIADVFFRPGLTGARIETTLNSAPTSGLRIRHEITDAATGALLCRNITQPKSGNAKAVSEITGLHPKLWSPEHPNLYTLRTSLLSGKRVIDEVTNTVGFRTIEARGNRIYLNGKPYFLRGANMPPHGLAPNDAVLADKFMRMMHEGNTVFTRFHMCPPPRVWIDAADRNGVGVSIEGSWPWVLMGNTALPDASVLSIWHKEVLDLVKAYRNHPSVLLITISNESYFFGHDDTDTNRKARKYKIFSDVIKDVRSACPAIPVVLSSGYKRLPEDAELLRQNRIDDGDIDDGHFYIGWYEQSPYSMSVPWIESLSKFGRPFISQEASTGYPDNDTGHTTEGYISQFHTPQAWVGQYGEYGHRPDMFLDIQAQITKDYAEKIRRDRTSLAGWLLFANINWFRDVYDPATISPYPVYWETKKAMQPVLVSLETANRHFESGQRFTSRVWVIDDDPDRPQLHDLTLTWRIACQSANPGACGTVSLPACAYDSKCCREVEFAIPDELPLDCGNATLQLEVRQGDELISRNDYPLICARSTWYASSQSIVVVDPKGDAASYLRAIGFQCRVAAAADWASLDPATPVVLAPDVPAASLGDKQAAHEFVLRGGRIVMLSTQKPPLDLVPDLPANQIHAVDAQGNFVDLLEPSLLDGMDPMDMHWWNSIGGDTVRVCKTSFQFPDLPGARKLAQHVQPHGYGTTADIIRRFTSWPVFEIDRGKGMVVVDSLLLSDDPVAKRFLKNLVSYLSDRSRAAK